jgi:hypothetical protein
MCAVNPLPLQIFKEYQYGFLGIRLQAKKFYVATDSMSNAEEVILYGVTIGSVRLPLQSATPPH